MAEVRKRWGDDETVAEKVRRRSLEWLGVAWSPGQVARPSGPKVDAVQLAV